MRLSCYSRGAAMTGGHLVLAAGPSSSPTGYAPPMCFPHTMLGVRDLDAALRFWCGGLGLLESRRSVHEAGRFTVVFLRAAEDAPAGPEVEIMFNWDQVEAYSGGRNFGHAVPDVYAASATLEEQGFPILRPPRDGRTAFVHSPDEQSVERLQAGGALAPAEPWSSRPNVGTW